MIRIRNMTAADLDLGQRLKAQAGWNQTEQDWRRFLSLSADGCFVAEADGRGVGTACTFIFGPVAWIAMVLVDSSMRNRGIGSALMAHALEHLDRRGIASVRLDATPLGKPVYEKLGFFSQFELSRYGDTVTRARAQDGHAAATAPTASGLSDPGVAAMVLAAAPADLDRIAEFDARHSATPRRALLEALHVEGHPMILAERDGRIAGYCCIRPGANAAQIGPLIADAEAGAPLLAEALRRLSGRPVFVDVPDDHAAAVAAVRAAGLSAQRPLTRMCRGRRVLESLSHLWASSGPEKG